MLSLSKNNRYRIAVEKWTIDIASLWKLTIAEVYSLCSFKRLEQPEKSRCGGRDVGLKGPSSALISLSSQNLKRWSWPCKKGNPYKSQADKKALLYYYCIGTWRDMIRLKFLVKYTWGQGHWNYKIQTCPFSIWLSWGWKDWNWYGVDDLLCFFKSSAWTDAY